MSLIDELRAGDKKGLFTSNDVFVNYSTGILPLDYANGFIQPYIDKDGNKQYADIYGIIGGTFTTIIGASGTGKTTLADQVGYNIIRPFENGLLIHVDSEKSAIKQRMIDIMGADRDDPRIILDKNHTSIEDVMELIGNIAEKKESGGNKYKYPVPNPWLFNSTGDEILVYEPTVIIIDSLYTFNSKNSKVSELEGGMSANREAKEVAQFYSKSLDIMQKYNITIIAINHIKSKVDTGMFSSAPKQLMLLGKEESLPRGQAPIYLAQNVFRANAIKSNMYTMEDNNFTGFKVTLQIAKTKSSFIGSTIDVCFNSAIGFDPIYSLYEYANSIGLIQGRNPYLYIQGLDTFKFNRKDFRNKFIESKEFRNEVLNTLEPHFKYLLGSKNSTEAEQLKYTSIDQLLSERAIQKETVDLKKAKSPKIEKGD